MEQGQAILELWRTFLRRFWILAGIGVAGILASGFLAYVLPPVFLAQAKILVESQQIPDDLARSTVTASAAERLQLIEQRLMTRDNMLRLIDDLNLYRNRSDLSVSEKVDQLRESIQIQPIGFDAQRRRDGGEISAFTIQVTFNDAGAAAGIANELVTTVLAQNIRARSERASETLDFFVNEQKRLAGELASIEADITAFKKEHENSLPDSMEFRRAQLVRTIESDRESDQRLLELEEKRGALQTALSQASMVEPAALSIEQQQLRELEAQLVQKRAVYAESHPDIRMLKAQIAALEASMPAAEGEASADPQEIQIASIRNQLDNLDAQVALLKEYKKRLAETRAALEVSINETPKVEIQLNALYRRHSELQTQYGEIVIKRTEAETGEKLEVNQQAERFEVIENAIVPEEPISPERKKVVMLGSAMSIAIAAGIVFLVEILRPAIRSAAQMERQLDLRPVVTVPYVTTRSDRRLRAIRISAFLILIFVGVPAALYIIDQYVIPLELIGAIIAEKSGLDDFIRVMGERL